MAYIIFLLILSAFTTCEAFKPKDHYLLSCGSTVSNSVASAFDGRTWYPDQNYTFSSSFTSTISVSANHHPSAPDSPFTAARIFNTSFTYTFPVSPGPKFLRLFFYPAIYSDQFDASGFFITVQANDHFLLRNFSAQLAVSYAPFTIWSGNTSDPYVIKEYYLTVPNTHNSLHLTFTPTPPSSYAFVNGIEIVSVPDSLYLWDYGIPDVQSPSIPFEIPISSALETVYRLNVGGNDVSVKTDGDQCGMYRHWKNDVPYLFQLYGLAGLILEKIAYTKQVPDYTAPEEVYQTFRELGRHPDFNKNHSLAWRFKVEPGFNYLLRLHWCQFDPRLNMPNDIVFAVYINNLIAESEADVMMWTHKIGVPVYKDYVLSVRGDGGGEAADIWLALHPNTAVGATYADALLNGLEIFKINRSDGGLDAPNPVISLDSKNLGKQNRIEQQKCSHLPALIGSIISGTLLTCLLVFCLIFRHKKAIKGSSTTRTSTSSKTNWIITSDKSGPRTSSRGSTSSLDLCHRFSLVQIELATNNFDERLIIGHGGFGNVYKGMVDIGEEGLMKVAIKRLNQSSKQGVHEFKTEIELLSKLRHVHLVSLIGYCDDNGEMILVYEYMDRGTLRDHLYNTDNPPMSWNQRLNACLGAAKGLHYLHAGASQMIIHRDVKSTNVLLDEKWASKVSDFGLSKLGPINNELSHISTVVKGSFGYVDPEYLKRQQLTEKSDVYSFGVVLFEVLCGRPALNPNLPKEQANLALWARSFQQKGALGAIVDHNIKIEIAPQCLRKFGEIAERCVRDHGNDRPSMADVVWSLEFALELQQKAVPMGEPVAQLNGYPGYDMEPHPYSSRIAADTTAKATTTASHDGLCFTSTTSGECLRRTNSSSSLIVSSSEGPSETASANVFSEIFKPEGR